MAKVKESESWRLGLPNYYFECPGCRCLHGIWTENFEGDAKWEFNGDLNRPTVSPSIKVTTRENVCHSFVRDGKIQFLNDCTHHLAGQTVELPEL